MTNALILNATYEPLHIVSWQKALQLLFQGKVEVIEESDHEVRTVRITVRVPAVLRLLSYVPLGRKKNVVRFSRTNVFLRDDHTCGYCLKKFNKGQLTLDHVIPVVQGGRKSWENIVTACLSCNQRKGGRTPTEANMKLQKKPRAPQWLPSTSLKLGVAATPERWKVYFRWETESPDDDPNDR
jgi:5-methylcytosine-specific restriction endonuclease McrA